MSLYHKIDQHAVHYIFVIVIEYQSSVIRTFHILNFDVVQTIWLK
jgi:hypothetical protein